MHRELLEALHRQNRTPKITGEIKQTDTITQDHMKSMCSDVCGRKLGPESKIRASRLSCWSVAGCVPSSPPGGGTGPGCSSCAWHQVRLTAVTSVLIFIATILFFKSSLHRKNESVWHFLFSFPASHHGISLDFRVPTWSMEDLNCHQQQN